VSIADCKWAATSRRLLIKLILLLQHISMRIDDQTGYLSVCVFMTGDVIRRMLLLPQICESHDGGEHENLLWYAHSLLLSRLDLKVFAHPFSKQKNRNRFGLYGSLFAFYLCERGVCAAN
jgi:hypothetical protein